MSIKVNIEAFINARIINGFSQRELAKRAELSSALISQIENNERNPSPSSAKKICEVLNVKFDEIFFTESVCNCKHITA
ncbi:helix-turn-helix domain-containing protein [Bacillus sp. ISL-7]|uniref:helix-turn-helix domain-containing protein n=1 Tax=Bacillus sp. ISL-7 TaxID=2819136 RepID=UPI001BE5E1C3|nr:helix-turn-helix transcriptional regulator [Bacillus sp. ISL-7]MBT2735181.1 helix-turn-helix transcriptional regulator [Bacillus sp. ISL-7]